MACRPIWIFVTRCVNCLLSSGLPIPPFSLFFSPFFFFPQRCLMIGFYSLKLAPHDHQGSLYRRVSRYRTVIRALETWPMMLLEIHCQPRSNFIPFGVRYVYAQFYSPRWRLQGSLDIALPNANSSIELTTTIVNFHSILFYRGNTDGSELQFRVILFAGWWFIEIH